MTQFISTKDSKIFVDGILNYDTVKRVFDESLPALSQQKKIQFDFSHVTKANSAALALMIEWKKYAKKHSMQISFENIPEKLKLILNASNLNNLFSI